MARYIDADAVFDWFCESADIDGCVDLPKNNGSCKKGCRHCIEGKELDEIPTADEEKIATEYCMKKGLVMIPMDYWEKVIAYENRGTVL